MRIMTGVSLLMDVQTTPHPAAEIKPD